MSNIISSDFYRLLHGAALRNTLIGLLGTVLIVGLAIFSFNGMSEGLTIYLDNGAVQETDSAEIKDAMGELNQLSPYNAAEFGNEIFSSNFVPFFFLPLIIAIFCADFTYGTYRNTLSNGMNRSKLYLAKLLLSIICCIALQAFSVLISWPIGGIFLGFGGFSAEYITHIAVAFLLMIPTQLAMICFGHCLVAFTKKSGTVIAVYLIAPMVLSIVMQTLAIRPRLNWLLLFDWASSGTLLIEYWNMSTGQILTIVCSGLIVAAATTALGVIHYQKADLH